MRITVFLLILIGFDVHIYAQNPDQVITEYQLQSFLEGKLLFATNIESLYEGVKGTPYFNEEWKTGDVYFLDGTKIIQINIRYNIYQGELEFKNSTSGQIFVINRNMIDGFKINEQKDSLHFTYISLKPYKQGDKSIVQVLYEGKTRLLLKHKKAFKKADYQGAYAIGEKYDEYKDDKDYYLVTDSETIQKIRLNKKSVLKALGDNQSVLKEFASMNQIDFKNPGDILKLLVFYDSQKSKP